MTNGVQPCSYEQPAKHGYIFWRRSTSLRGVFGVPFMRYVSPDLGDVRISPCYSRTSVARVLYIPGPPNRVTSSLCNCTFRRIYPKISTTNSCCSQPGMRLTSQPRSHCDRPDVRAWVDRSRSENAAFVRYLSLR